MAGRGSDVSSCAKISEPSALPRRSLPTSATRLCCSCSASAITCVTLSSRAATVSLARFVSIVSESGADRFSVHARKAWLKGLSPKANRNIPPIRYEDVYRLKADFPHLPIEINGHVKSLDESLAHLTRLDAVMIGRASLWALAVGGQAGVENVLDVLRGGIDSAMLGLGKASLGDLSPTDLVIPDDFTEAIQR